MGASQHPVDVLAELLASDPDISPETLGEVRRYMDEPVVRYIGATPDGKRFDAATVEPLGLTCLRCGWLGSRAMLKEVPYMPDDDYPIEGETQEVCPECESSAWEPL